MSADKIHNLVWSFIGVVALLGVIQLVAIPTAVEMFRHRIFELRRQLFLLLVDGYVKPDDIAYRRTRATMNGLLRFAERITLLRLIVLGRNQLKTPEQYRKERERTINLIQSAHAREELTRLNDEVAMAILVHLLRISPILWLGLFCIGIVEWFRATVRRMATQQPAQRMARRLQVERIEVDVDDLERCAI